MNKNIFRNNIFAMLFLLSLSQISFSQQNSNALQGYSANTINTYAPFVQITPDARSGALGDAGVATSPDANSNHHNPAKFAFIENNMGLDFSYTPWLREEFNDINLYHLAAFRRINQKQVISLSTTYFNLEPPNSFVGGGANLIDFRPFEFYIDMSYSRILTPNLSGGIAIRYIYSDITYKPIVPVIETHAGKSLACDFSVYYQNKFFVNQKETYYTLGINVSNIGSKITYTDDSQQNFIPMNLKLGGTIGTSFNNRNAINLILDMNKLLVPTPPDWDSNHPGDTNYIIKGKDPNVSVAKAILQSFHDAPGGFSEELHEISYSTALEYWYHNVFAARVGYFYEHPTKGNRHFLTTGLGLKLKVITLDFSYILPEAKRNPMANTWRLSVGINL